MPDLGDFRAGQPFGRRGRDGYLRLDGPAARRLDALRARVARLGNLRGVPPILVGESAAGRRIAAALERPFPAKLSGSANPYGYAEQAWTGSAWADLATGRTGTDAFEANSVTGLGGKVVLLRRTLVGDLRFQFVRYGGVQQPACGQICVTVKDTCSGAILEGATVSVAKAGATVGSCTTTGQVQAVTQTAPGSGYTSFPGISFTGGGGTGATAIVTAMMASGATVATGGSGYAVGNTLTVVGGTATTVARLSVGAVSAGAITAVSVTLGSAYSKLPTNPVTVTGGTGTGATFNLTWRLNGLAVTAGGSGYTSAPTVTVDAPPSGTRATVTATRAVQCCVPVSSSGTAGQYTVTVSAPGYVTTTASMGAVTCLGSTLTTATISLSPVLIPFSVCVTGPCQPVATGKGCGTGLNQTNIGVAGATVTITGPPNPITGTTDINGLFATSLPAGTYTITATYPRFADVPTTTTTLGGCSGGVALAFQTVGSAYVCSGSIIPFSRTLYVSDPVYGPITMTYDATQGNWSAVRYVTTAGYVWPSDNRYSCPGAANVRQDYLLGTGGIIVRLRAKDTFYTDVFGNSTKTTCPCAADDPNGVDGHISEGTVNNTTSPPPGYFVTGQMNPAGSPSSIYPGTQPVTLSVSEAGP
jgi:hypothetical protein